MKINTHDQMKKFIRDIIEPHGGEIQKHIYDPLKPFGKIWIGVPKNGAYAVLPYGLPDYAEEIKNLVVDCLSDPESWNSNHIRQTYSV